MATESIANAQLSGRVSIDRNPAYKHTYWVARDGVAADGKRVHGALAGERIHETEAAARAELKYVKKSVPDAYIVAATSLV